MEEIQMSLFRKKDKSLKPFKKGQISIFGGGSAYVEGKGWLYMELGDYFKKNPKNKNVPSPVPDFVKEETIKQIKRVMEEYPITIKDLT